MELTGRLTADATVRETKDGRQVVNFSVAINDSYKSKGSDEIMKVVTYFNCSYWQRPAIAPFLTKGLIVELYGRVGVNAWKDMNGEPRADLVFHVNSIRMHGGSKRNAVNEDAKQAKSTEPTTNSNDDLPF